MKSIIKEKIENNDYSALCLENITKVYGTGENAVVALKGISLKFRKNEFVSILGQSGCGKTTMLNIVGGLDRYSSGDLKINGVSTKNYSDADWDTYRNNSIGFVFQSYNLIPHQTVLSNVELALTLSGVSKNERRKKAIAVLEKVGLKGQENKKPNQLSGGQMQRVAIARALVNDPEIILADEPTGALDTETSIQVMDLLKEVAKDRLVIMVTHNPELAKKYSTRIINLLDGLVTGDTNPYDGQGEKQTKKGKKGRAAMKFITAFSLSLSNLKTKKGRTTLTSIAGSIGIIGIALVLAVSTGFSSYINKLQADTLSVYPITISESSIDLTDFNKLLENEGLDKFPTVKEVYTRALFDDLANMLKSNKISEDYIDYVKQFTDKENEKKKDSSEGWAYCLQKSYGFDVNNFIYSEMDFSLNEGIHFNSIMPIDMLVRNIVNLFETSMAGTGITASFVRQYIPTVSELPDSISLLKSQYDIIDDGGYWATEEDELMLVVNDVNSVSDITLALLGFKDILGVDIEAPGVKFDEKNTFTFEEVKNKTFYYVDSNTRYREVSDSAFIEYGYGEGELPSTAMPLKITGILRLKDGINQGVLENGGIAYTSKLTERILKDNKESNIVNASEGDSAKVYSAMNPRSYYQDLVKKMSPVPIEEVTDDMIKAFIDNVKKEQAFGLGVSVLENTVRALAGIDTVSKLKIYSVDYKAKEDLKVYLDTWNSEDRLEEDQVHYSDSTAMLFSALNTIVDAVKIVLIAFTAISLVVSSIMIGIITYVSVVERTKEIGVLRSIGARKKDISRIFNAETFLIGLFAGILGVAVTYLLTIPINAIVGLFIVNAGNIASLKIIDALILVAVSFALTLIAGIVPSKIAAKKDPVIALRSE